MQTELKLEHSREPRRVFKSIQKPLVYIRQYLHDIEWFAQMQGEHPRFAHLWRTSFRTSHPPSRLREDVKRRKGEGGGGRRKEGVPEEIRE